MGRGGAMDGRVVLEPNQMGQAEASTLFFFVRSADRVRSWACGRFGPGREPVALRSHLCELVRTCDSRRARRELRKRFRL